MIDLLLANLIGIGFGFCLERAGFGSSKRLTGIFYFRDMTVFKVMFTAVITAAAGLQLLLSTGLLKESALSLTPTILAPQLVGGVLFGTGFALGGWCPGTALAGIVSGKIDALLFLIGGIAGSLLFTFGAPHLSSFLSWGDLGVVHTYESLNISRPLFIALFTTGAVLSLWLVEKVWPYNKKQPA